MHKLVWVAACLGVAACVNGYSQFYAPAPAATLARAEPYNGPVSVVASSGSARQDIDFMYCKGFGPIGMANFNGPEQNVAGALLQAKKVGAEYVVVARQYARTVTGAIPITTFAPHTSYTNGTVNAYGSGGFATGSYSGTTTSYDSQTNYVPYSVDRYDQEAIFFAPMRRTGFGMHVDNVDDDLARRLGSQKGVVVLAVRRGSPAFQADMLPGDVIVAINGTTILDRDDVAAKLAQEEAQEVMLNIRRGDKTLVKKLSLVEGWSWH